MHVGDEPVQFCWLQLSKATTFRYTSTRILLIQKTIMLQQNNVNITNTFRTYFEFSQKLNLPVSPRTKKPLLFQILKCETWDVAIPLNAFWISRLTATQNWCFLIVANAKCFSLSAANLVKQPIRKPYWLFAVLFLPLMRFFLWTITCSKTFLTEESPSLTWRYSSL